MWLVATIFNSTGLATMHLMFERETEIKRAWSLLEIIGFRESLAYRQSLKPCECMSPPGGGPMLTEKTRMKLLGSTTEEGEQMGPEKEKGKAEGREWCLKSHRRNIKERAVQYVIEKQIYQINCEKSFRNYNTILPINAMAVFR